MSIVRLLARPLLATGFIAAGVDRLRDSDQTAEHLRPTLDRVGSMVPSAASITGNPALVAKVLGATQVGAGSLLARTTPLADVQKKVDGMSIFLVDLREARSEERRVGKECRSRWSPYH